MKYLFYRDTDGQMYRFAEARNEAEYLFCLECLFRAGLLYGMTITTKGYDNAAR